MSSGSSGPDSEAHGSAELEATRTVAGGRPSADGAAEPAASATAGAAVETVTPRTATEVVRHGPGLTVTAGPDPAGTQGYGLTGTEGLDLTVTTGPQQDGPAVRQVGTSARPTGLVRHGPGVPAVPPAGRAGLTAEHV